ncbi:sensor histidine kinase [Cryptosporangium aurantiacum]|uniref:histidine kinase n=1 Tax=Cryptosporangium aurantiacum TaxID=134849 RepID=A0A1M7RBQ4_9ACTN|nr:histidine kinase [Cryptosporangium aurantiacum]SHN43646.1 Signal transduction histidine kinase [Cryptosporangium aurantiacum]
MTRLRRIGADVLLWAVLCALLPLNGERLADGTYVNWLALASLVVAVAVGLRRIAPLTSLVLAAGLLVFDVWLAAPFAGLAFLVGRSTVQPRSALQTFAAVGAGGAACALIRSALVGTDPWVAYSLVAEIVFCGIFPWLVGRYLRQRRELAVGGWALAEELERGQTLVAERARLRERTRIAEDMHDALGHELSLIALRAGALELDRSLGPAQREAAAELRAGAAAATERLRTVIGVLRAGADAPLQPADETITTLVDRVRRAGLVIDWRIQNNNGVDAGQQANSGLPPLADRALYRVVQEGLTNAARHAPGNAVTGRLTIAPETVTVVLTNPLAPGEEDGSRTDRAGARPAIGTTAGGAGAGTVGGTGLLGLAERVRLAGGTLTTDTGGGTFTLTATVPREPATALTPAPDAAPSRAAARESRAAALVSEAPAEASGRLARARRRTRRGLALTVLVPAAAAVLLVGTVVGAYVVETRGSVLTPLDAARLHVGQAESEARDILPYLEVTERPNVSEPARPPGARCEYYNVSGELFPPVRDVYRICFADEKVAGIDLIPGRTARGGRG